MYRHDPVFAAAFGALATEFYSPRRCFAHYLHMAFGNWRDYLRLARPPPLFHLRRLYSPALRQPLFPSVASAVARK